MSMRLEREVKQLAERVKKLEEALEAEKDRKSETRRSLLSLRNRTATSDVL